MVKKSWPREVKLGAVQQTSGVMFAAKVIDAATGRDLGDVSSFVDGELLKLSPSYGDSELQRMLERYK